MSYLDMVEQFISENIEVGQPKPIIPTIEQVTNMKLSEFARRDIAIEIDSKVLGCHVWLCSNELMVSKIKKDDSSAITYTANELTELIKLNPSPEDTKRVHSVKEVFNNSKIINGKSKNGPISELEKGS